MKSNGGTAGEPMRQPPPSPLEEVRATRSAWAALAVLFMLYALSMVDRQIIALLVEPMRADLGINDLQIGLLQGFSFALLYSICGLPLGLAVDRYSRRLVIFGGVMVWALAATACGLAANFGELLLARMLVGAGEAALAPAAYSILSDMFPRKRLTFALGVFACGAQLGGSASKAIGGLILRHAADGVDMPVIGLVSSWQFAFLITGLPGILLAFLIFLVPEPARRGAKPASPSTWGDMFRFLGRHWKFFTAHFIGFSCIMGSAFARGAWLPATMERHFGWEIGTVGVILAVYTLVVGVIGLPVTGWFVDRWSERGMKDAHFRFYVYGGLAIAVVGAPSFYLTDAWHFLLVNAVAAVPMGMAAIAASAIQIVTPADLRGRVSGFYLMVVGLLAMSLGPAIVGLFTDNLFGDPQQVHQSLALSYLLFGGIAAAAFVWGLKPMREAVTAAQ